MKPLRLVIIAVACCATARAEVTAENLVAAQRFASAYFSAEVFKDEEVLRGVDGVNVEILIDDALKKIISADEVKDTVELTLQKNSVTVAKAGSRYTFAITVEGLWLNEHVFVYSAHAELFEPLRVLRLIPGDSPTKKNPVFGIQNAPIWRRSFTGYAGKQKIRSELISYAESFARAFSNSYLAANPRL